MVYTEIVSKNILLGKSLGLKWTQKPSCNDITQRVPFSCISLKWNSNEIIKSAINFAILWVNIFFLLNILSHLVLRLWPIINSNSHMSDLYCKKDNLFFHVSLYLMLEMLILENIFNLSLSFPLLLIFSSLKISKTFSSFFKKKISLS